MSRKEQRPRQAIALWVAVPESCRDRRPDAPQVVPALHVLLTDAGFRLVSPLRSGRQRIGREVDYSVDPRRAERFYAAIRRYWPALPDGALAPAYAGIRPKISGPKEPAADFVLQGPAQHGIPGLVNLFGIESPGLTASLALAEQVKDIASPVGP